MNTIRWVCLKVLDNHLAGIGLPEKDLAELADALGETKERDYGYTFSDIRQRVIPSIVLETYPKHKITKALVLQVIEANPPTAPFTAE